MSEGPGKGRGKGKGKGKGKGHERDWRPNQHDVEETAAPPPAQQASAGPAVEGLEGAVASLLVAEKPTAQPSTKPKPSSEETWAEKSIQCLIRRPGIGQKGRPIKLITNHFPFSMPGDLVVQHYDMTVFRLCDGEKDPKTGKIGDKVLVEMKKLPKFVFTKIYSDLIQKNPNFFPDRHTLAFDGNKNIFSKMKLQIDKTGKEFKVIVKNEEKLINDEFIVRVKWASEIKVDLKKVFDRNLVERKSIATLVLDVILKQTTMFDPYYVPCGRRIFYHPDPRDMYPLGAGIVRYPGFWQSVRPVSGWKVMLNIDQANTAFVKEGSVLKMIQELGFDPPRVSDRDIPRLHFALEKLVRGVKITTIQRREHRTAKCLGVTKKSAANETFNVTLAGDLSEKTISVAEYFRIMYRNKEFTQLIKYPNLPCLQVGNPRKNNFVPIEFCEVKEGQRYSKKLNDSETSKMLNSASQGAPERLKKIQEDAEYMKFDEDPFLKGFGFNVSLKMAEVIGRIVPAPRVEYHNQTLSPVEGGWNMQRVKVIQGCEIRNFAVISTVDDHDCNRSSIERFVSEWVKSAKGMGIKVVADRACYIDREFYADNMGARLRGIKEKCKNVDLVFVILKSQNTEFYGFAKAAGDVTYGINTQCIQLKNVNAAKPATLANICLKINGKLGGVNSVLAKQNKQEVKFFLNEPILFLGADVNHPSPEEKDEPISCAAVVGNVDLYPSMYSARILLQRREVVKIVDGKEKESKRPQEWISNMKDAVKGIIYHFVERNRCLPRRIVFYRDGVGETMFSQILTKELTAIRLACEEMEQRYPAYVKGFAGKYEPPITFVVVQKRHHTRLFCANRADEMGRGRNVPPGTTVDTGIVHPDEFDFYLCSHLGIQGTSRPTHYHVLHDDSNFSADDLQTLTYYLCHTYIRATRSVSIPPPCYYADLVAYRARKYLDARSSSDTASVSTTSSRLANSLTELQRFVSVDETILKKGMFFV